MVCSSDIVNFVNRASISECHLAGKCKMHYGRKEQLKNVLIIEIPLSKAPAAENTRAGVEEKLYNSACRAELFHRLQMVTFMYFITSVNSTWGSTYLTYK